MEHQLVVLHKGNLAVGLEAVGNVEIGGILVPFPWEQKLLHLLIRVALAAGYRHLGDVNGQKQDSGR